MAYPFAQFCALSTGRLRAEVSDFESHRAGDLGEDEIKMLFRNQAVLDWLLAGRYPQDLDEMNLVGKDRTPEEKPRGDIVYLLE